METSTPSLQDQRKRKLLLMMPLIIFCSATLLFRAFGGGQEGKNETAKTGGLSLKLPSAIIAADQTGDKMSFYSQALADSLKKQQLRKADPYAPDSPKSVKRLNVPYPGTAFSPHQPAYGEMDDDNGNLAGNEARINQRLTELQAVISKPSATPAIPTVKSRKAAAPDSLLKPTTAAEDPELRQMNGLLEKILDIQHPDRVKAAAEKKPATTLVKKFRAIPAVIDGTQKIVQGTVVCLKLMDTVTLGGHLFTKGQHIYGSGSLSNQRYTMNIKSILTGFNFYPVDLTVFDQRDGLEGISVPEAITNDALLDGAGSGIQHMDLMSFDPSVTAQLATAGINTAKGLFGKKIKRVKGKLKNGHPLLLRDNQEVKNIH